MKKRFYFGKIDANGNGRKENKVYIDIELKETKNGEVFTASGVVYNRLGTDCIMGGQCLDTLSTYKELASNKKFKTILKLWEQYHLNDMHAGTKEQENFIKEHKNEIETKLKELFENRKFTWQYVSNYDAICEVLKEHNLYEVEHNGQPYKYGHSWLFEEIPQNDLQIIKQLFEEKGENE